MLPSLVGSSPHVCGACGTGIEKVGRQLLCRRWIPLGLGDRVPISEVWDHLIADRLVEAATGLGVEGGVWSPSWNCLEQYTEQEPKQKTNPEIQNSGPFLCV